MAAKVYELYLCQLGKRVYRVKNEGLSDRVMRSVNRLCSKEVRA
jgi:hypothetical protein